MAARQRGTLRARSLDLPFWLVRNTWGAEPCEMRENKVPRHRSRPRRRRLMIFARSFALIALDVVDVRPYYSNSVLWTLEMDYITTLKDSGKVHG